MKNSRKRLDSNKTGLKQVCWTYFDKRPEAVCKVLNASGLASFLSSPRTLEKKIILIKPNLVNQSPFPVTTPCWIVRELVRFIKATVPGKEIIIGEGTGQPGIETGELFSLHGYTNIKGVELVDLNHEKCVEVRPSWAKRWKSLFIPALLLDCFVISVPVLKAHTLAGVTLSMKNMIGVCPPRYYQSDGSWRKSAFHTKIHHAIFELNRVVAPDFCLLDATVGLCSSHLSGPACDPPVNVVAASNDPVAMDAFGARLLSIKWQTVGHIAMAHDVLGLADASSVYIQ